MKKAWLKKITLDDIRVKNKLILLFMSVLIPILVTNIVHYLNIIRNVKEQQTVFLKEAIQTIQANVISRIEDCTRITDMFYQDNVLSMLLSKDYTNPQEYYQVYDSVLENYIKKYEKMYSQIYEINIYTTNPSLLSGGGYYYINDSISNSNWYKKVILSKNDICLDAYINNSRYSTLKKQVRYFSIVRKLDRLAFGSVVKKFIKVDIDLNYINDILDSDNINMEIYIVNEYDQVIFSNNPYYNNFSEEFLFFHHYVQRSETLIYREEMKGLLEGYQIITVAPKALFMDQINYSMKNLLVLTLMNLVFPCIVILLISRSFKNRIEMLSCHIKKIRQDRFVLDLVKCREGKDEIGQLIQDFNQMAIRMDGLINDVYQASINQKNLEIEKKQAELNALHSQINPHFLFNTLETIRMRSLLKEENETANIIKSLSKLLRTSLNWGSDLVMISEELSFTEEYLKLQMYRFDDKLRYDIYADEKAKQCKIPKLSIMTLVENACIHGIESIERAGYIEIKVEETDGKVRVIVKDNGIGMSEEKLKDLLSDMERKDTPEASQVKSIGFKNVYRRLKMLYEEQFSLSIRSVEGKGTEVQFEFYPLIPH